MLINNVLFEDVVDLIQKKIQIKKSIDNYLGLWKTKMNFLNKYYKENYNDSDYDFNYYKGLSELALRLLKISNIDIITYGVSINRFYKIDNINDLYNPINIKYGPVVNTISEFIKNEFFSNRVVDYKKIFEIDLGINDYYFLVARLLFPTYYFDLYKDKNIVNKYETIVNRIEDYIKYIKEVIIEIKKRHNNMPLLDNIVNLL